MFKYIAPFIFLSSAALAQDVSAPINVYPGPVQEEWNRKAMNEQVDKTLFNIADHCSGTLISQKYRLIITNYHCVDDLFETVEEEVVDPDTGEIKKVKKQKKKPLDIMISNDDVVTKYRAEVEGYNRDDDLALLKVKSEKFPANGQVPLAPEKWCERGMPAWAVGNPIMLEASVTKGVISYCDRLMDESRGLDIGEKRTQFDTPIAGGSSGGGLFNYKGELIGVTNSGYRGADMAFAVPVEKVKELLKAKGYESVYNPAAIDKDAADKKRKEDAAKEKWKGYPGSPGGH